MRTLVGIYMLVFSGLAHAGGYTSSDVEKCGFRADRQLQTVLKSVDFPAEYLQVGWVDRVERMEFYSTTPGSYDQEYLGRYRLIYRTAIFPYFREQTLEVRFRSSFICESIKVSCIKVVSSQLAPGVSPELISAAQSPLVCN